MASVSAKAPGEVNVDKVTGQFQVSSTVVTVRSEQREELHNLTSTVRSFVKSSGIRDGFVNISSLHTTAALFVNEWQDALIHEDRKSTRLNSSH